MSPRGAVLELVEEDLGGGDGAEQVDLDHLPVVVALVAVERAEQHDAGVVDQDVGVAESRGPGRPRRRGCRGR